MTNPTLTIQAIAQRKHRLVVVDHPGIQKVNLDTYQADSSAKQICSDLTFAQAHEIADWIKANVPEPKREFAVGTIVKSKIGTIYTKISGDHHGTWRAVYNHGEVRTLPEWDKRIEEDLLDKNVTIIFDPTN